MPALGTNIPKARSNMNENKRIITRQKLKRHARSPIPAATVKRRPALGNITNVRDINARDIVDKVKIPDDLKKKPTYHKDSHQHLTTVTRVKREPALGGGQPSDSEYYIFSSSSQESESDSSQTTSSQQSNVDSENEKNLKLSQQVKEEKPIDDRVSVSLEYNLPDGVVDIDKEIYTSIENVPEYAKDIFIYLRKREHLFVTPTDNLPGSIPNRLWKKRENMVKWFTQVQEEYGINHETMYAAIKLFDLQLLHIIKSSHVPDSVSELCVIAGGAFFLACKLDNQLGPTVDEFVDMLESRCTKKDLIKMEMSISKCLDFNLMVPHSYEFLRRYGKCIQLDMPSITLARYILETMNMDHTYLPLLDSKKAAAALYLTLKMLDWGSWSAQLRYYTEYTPEDLIPIAERMINTLLHYSSRPQTDINPILMKYQHTVFFKVAEIPLISDKALREDPPSQE